MYSLNNTNNNKLNVRFALGWWLYLDTSGSSLCSLCPNIILDPLGHHAASCRCSGDVVVYGTTIFVTSLPFFCLRAHLSVKVEVGYGSSRGHINSRPADILVQGWDRGMTAGIDVTVTSPLTLVARALNEASVSAAHTK